MNFNGFDQGVHEFLQDIICFEGLHVLVLKAEDKKDLHDPLNDLPIDLVLNKTLLEVLNQLLQASLLHKEIPDGVGNIQDVGRDVHQNEDFENLGYDLVNVSVILQHIQQDVLDSDSAEHADGLLVS